MSTDLNEAGSTQQGGSVPGEEELFHLEHFSVSPLITPGSTPDPSQPSGDKVLEDVLPPSGSQDPDAEPAVAGGEPSEGDLPDAPSEPATASTEESSPDARFVCQPRHLRQGLSIREEYNVPAHGGAWWNPEDFWKALSTEDWPLPSETEVTAVCENLEAYLNDKPMFYFEDARALGQAFLDVREDLRTPLWFIGDVHGDILALSVALEYIKQTTKDAKIILLGDLFDRGVFQAQVLYVVLELITRQPATFGFVVGNHDEGLKYNEAEDKFYSSVEPSEYAIWLETLPKHSAWRRLSRAAIEFFARAPRAILLPDGLLVAHGGVPHVDQLDLISDPKSLNQGIVTQDFIWTRLHETAKKRVPNRSSRGCSLGSEDFHASCDKMEQALKRPITGMIRGHDHVEERFKYFRQYQPRPVLTINCMCHRQPDEFFGDFCRPVVLARWHPGTMPLVYKLEVPEEIIRKSHDPSYSKKEGSGHEGPCS